MAVARTPAELARLLWGNGLDRWFAARPDWALQPPGLGQALLTLEARHHSGRRLALAVGAPQGQPTVPPPLWQGSGLQVAWAGDGEASHEGLELARIIASADRRGLALQAPRHVLAVLGPTGEDLPGRVAPIGGVLGRRVELFIASGCNLHCGFCCESERIKTKAFMPWTELREKLESAAALGADLVQFMGGEPTLHPRFPDALRLCRELGMRSHVITNLMRWEQRSFAEEVGPLLDEIMISMHAWGEEKGLAVTAVRSWWSTFQAAAKNAEETLQASVRCSTVLTRDNVDDLERIMEQQLRFQPTAWVMGNAVPVKGTRVDVVDGNLTLEELHGLRPRLESMSARAAEAGCRLVFFTFPHCVLGPKLWDDSHDLVVGDQDLSDDAPDGVADVTFWSRADYLEQPKPVTLGRRRSERCRGCLRESVCGGWFSAALDRHGDAGLEPIAAPGEELTP